MILLLSEWELASTSKCSHSDSKADGKPIGNHKTWILVTGGLSIILQWVLEVRNKKKMARVKKRSVGESTQTEKRENKNVDASYICFVLSA